MLSKIKKIINDKNINHVKMSESEIPVSLVARYRKHFTLAGIILIAGLFVCMFMFSGFEMFKAFLMPMAISAGIFLEGAFMKRKILNEGYDSVEGVCVDYKYSNVGSKLINGDFSVKKQVTGLIVETNKKIIMLPVSKLNDIPAVGGNVIAYLPKNAVERKNMNGVTMFSSVYGYEIIPGEETANTSFSKTKTSEN